MSAQNPLVVFRALGATHVAMSKDWSVYLIGSLIDDVSMNVMGEMVHDETLVLRQTRIESIRPCARLAPIEQFL